MPGFQYFLPTPKTMLAPGDLEPAGLAYAFDDPGRIRAPAIVGPDGQVGLLLSDPLRVEPGRDGYHPDRQTWSKHHAKGFYVGYETAQRPRPEDLARRKLLPGPKLQLGDDRLWQVPRAKSWSGDDDPRAPCRYDIELDQRLEMIDGEMRPGRVLERYAQLWAIAQAWHRYAVSVATEEDEQQLGFEADHSLSFTSACVLAIRVLSANYALGIVEACQLGLLTKENWEQILNELIDLQTYVDLREKKTARLLAEESSSAGPAGTPPVTDPRSPTS